MSATTRPVEKDLPEPNALEKRASLYLTSRSRRAKAAAGGREIDRNKLASIRRRAVTWAIVSGILSGAIIGGTEVWLRLVYSGGIENLAFRDQLPYWAAFYAFVGAVTVVEMAFLYWNALDATAKVTTALGAPLNGDGTELVAVGLARAALEAPNPHHVVHGVDPYALMPKWRLLAHNLLYKAKVGASSFILRIIMRRLFARAALRGYIPLLAIPLYAIWNAWITWRVVDEARLRALGPGVIKTVVGLLRDRKDAGSADVREAILQGVGEIVMRGYDAHPNYIMLVRRLVDELDPESDEIEVDWDNREADLADLDEDEKTLLLGVLTISTVLAGRPRGDQRKFLEAVYNECGREMKPDALKQLRKALTAGRGIGEQDLKAVRA
jgi:hypothetical protein